MGKGTDKLYITHSEWSSGDAYSASTGSTAKCTNQADNAIEAEAISNFKRLPFNYCSLSLQPFREPVCTPSGTIFDLSGILSWLLKHGTNPIDQKPLRRADLISLHFSQNEQGEFVDPVTLNPFSAYSHIVALRPTGNVFTWDTVDRLNIKPKHWFDLVSDVRFTRDDIIVLQPAMSKNSIANATGKDSTCTINTNALGNAAKVLQARDAVARARKQRELEKDKSTVVSASLKLPQGTEPCSPLQQSSTKPVHLSQTSNPRKANFAHYTTGQAAASFTSTGLTPYTEASLAVLSDEEFLLKPKRIKTNGYAIIVTNLGNLNIELYPEYAPRAVWNFLRLAEKGYYRNLTFHRNIPNFMIQGGDPTGTGRGGESIWGKPFIDEVNGPLIHDSRGIVSMANKGKNTNSSQFFITYRACPHLDRKHTVFGRIIDCFEQSKPDEVKGTVESKEDGVNEAGSFKVLFKLEHVPTTENHRPVPDAAVIKDVRVLIDPFTDYMDKVAAEVNQAPKAKVNKLDDEYTWTGKKVKRDKDDTSSLPAIGRYLKRNLEQSNCKKDSANREIAEIPDLDDGKRLAYLKSRLISQRGGKFS